MTLAYEPSETIVRRLDPRGKLVVQIAFAVAAFAHTTPRGLAVLSVLCAAVFVLSRLSVFEVLWELRYVLVLVGAPAAIEAFTWDPPWVSLADARAPALASYRVLLVLCVSAAYVKRTPVRDSEAAIRWAIPGKPGRLASVGVSLVVRFLPVLQADLAGMRRAMATRLGDERPVTERMEIIAVGGLERAFGRADRLALAMNARCLSWNPTLPALRPSRADIAALALAAGLFVWALL